MLELLAAASLLTAQPACAPINGSDALLARPERILVVGETHGNVETPAAFLAIVCAAAQQGPVTVGLEMPESDRGLLDFVMAAPDEASATRYLRGGDFGDPRRDDGRNSQAMFDMIIGFWRLKAAGHDIVLRPFAARMSVIRGRPQAWWELEMAYGMSRPLVDRPDARLLILVGNLHARKTVFERWPEVGLPAAGHLHAADTLTLRVTQQGGQSWSCQEECRAHDSRAVDDPDARGIILGPVDDGAYDGVLAVGPTTASPPAALAD
ncbi:MAG: hypothetical protein EON88_02885 [Brevundimonas sp.]|nr:MAG: hypothetical protein EON88_02885 [Brevundimonas sp.]